MPPGVLIVTGGSRGIGAATACMAAARGFSVAVNYLQDRIAADSVVKTIEDGGGRAVAIQCDVAVEADVVRLFESSDEALGPPTALVNMSSGASRVGAPGEYVDYAASKGAIDTMTIGLAKEVAGEGIRVNAVRAGFIYTEIHTSGGEPNRVDRVKAFVRRTRRARSST